MPVLENAKHEAYAQGLAAGKTQRRAYIDAGYEDGSGSESNACRLLNDPKVAARVLELKEAAAKVAIDAIGFSRAVATQKLLEFAEAARAACETNKDGPLMRAGVAAIAEAAKLNGLYPEKLPANSIVVNPGGKDDALKTDKPGVQIIINGNNADL